MQYLEAGMGRIFGPRPAREAHLCSNEIRPSYLLWNKIWAFVLGFVPALDYLII